MCQAGTAMGGHDNQIDMVLLGEAHDRVCGTSDGERDLRPWDVAFFADGPDGAHKVTNNTDETLRVAMLSNKGDPGVAIYPDSDKIGVFPPNKLFRVADEVDYWDGET